MQTRLSKAQCRALVKAGRSGFIMISGGFGGDTLPDDEIILHPLFDKRCIIDRLIARGLMAAGEGANQYVHTAAGREIYEKRFAE